MIIIVWSPQKSYKGRQGCQGSQVDPWWTFCVGEEGWMLHCHWTCATCWPSGSPLAMFCFSLWLYPHMHQSCKGLAHPLQHPWIISVFCMMQSFNVSTGLFLLISTENSLEEAESPPCMTQNMVYIWTGSSFKVDLPPATQMGGTCNTQLLWNCRFFGCLIGLGGPGTIGLGCVVRRHQWVQLDYSHYDGWK